MVLFSSKAKAYGAREFVWLFIPALAKRKGGVSNTSSAISNNGRPNASLYAASTGAVWSVDGGVDAQ